MLVSVKALRTWVSQRTYSMFRWAVLWLLIVLFWTIALAVTFMSSTRLEWKLRWVVFIWVFFTEGTLCFTRTHLLWIVGAGYLSERWLSSVVNSIAGCLSWRRVSELRVVLVVFYSLLWGWLQVLRVHYWGHWLHNSRELLILYSLVCIYVQPPNHSDYFSFWSVVARSPTKM